MTKYFRYNVKAIKMTRNLNSVSIYVITACNNINNNQQDNNVCINILRTLVYIPT